MIKKMLRRLPPETLRYIIAGVATTAVSLGMFALLHYAFNMGERLSNGISIAVAILFAFAVNKLYVFGSREGGGTAAAEFVKFVGGRLVTMAVEYYGYIAIASAIASIAAAFTAWGAVRYGAIAAKAATQVVVFALNYVISKALVFRNRVK